MPIVLLIIGLAMLVTAYNNTFGSLSSALGQDIPSFAKWAVSLMLVGGLGYVPGMQTVSRWLLGLVLVVLVLRSYQANSSIFANFASALSGATKATSQTDPATQYATSAKAPSSAQIAGTTSSSSSATSAVASAASAATSSLASGTPYASLISNTVSSVGSGSGFGGNGVSLVG